MIILNLKNLFANSKNITSAVSTDSGPGEDLLIFLSFNTIVIHYVFVSKSKKCTSKIPSS